MKTVYIADDGTQFTSRQECLDYENKPYIYCVENTINEYHTQISRYCSSLEEAKRELEECCDWYRSKGTGRIYAIRLDTGMDPIKKLVYESN